MIRPLLVVTVIAVGACLPVVLGGCKRGAELVPVTPDRPAYALIVVPMDQPAPSGSTPVLQVEVSATADTRRRGLSHRDALGEDNGMLFVYGSDRDRMFWMKDCLIGLDIAFLRQDGTITDVATLPPGVGVEPVPTASSSEPVRYVLEANAGWYERRGVAAGDRVDISRAVKGVGPE